MNFKNFAVCFAMLAMALPGAFCQPMYTISDLGTLGGSGSQAKSINNSGQVVGESWTAGNSVEDAFLYGGGAMTNLGALGGSGSQANGINNSGQAVGYAYTAGNSAYYAFLYRSGAMTNLGALGGSFSEAYGINNSGQVVGWTSTTNGADHPFLYNGSTMIDLGTLGGSYGTALGLNDNGQVVGEAATASGAQHAFLYSSGAMTNLGTLGGSYSQANGINNSGQIVGWAYTTGGAQHAFLYGSGAMNDLGTLGGSSSVAYGINAGGQVVGYGYTTGGAEHAFLYGGGMMVDLNTLIPSNSVWDLEVAGGINDNGQIVGWGLNSSNHEDAFLLTPIPLSTPPLITAQPTGQTNLVGTTATFGVGVNGAATWPQLFGCQWQLAGTNLPAATNYSLVLTNLMLSQAGNSYAVVIANSFGSVTSGPAVLDVRFILVTVNGQPAAPTMSAVASATVTIAGGYPGGFIFYTLDGSTPTTSSTLYSGPITLTNSVVLQAMNLSEDFSAAAYAAPVTVQIIPVYTVQTSVVGTGTISLNPVNGPYASNSVVTLTANAAQYWAFDHWTGDVTGSQNPVSLTMDGPHSVQAVFVPTLPLTATTPGGGSVSVNGLVMSSPAYFPTGSVVTVAAVASNGWSFMGWQGNASGTNNPLSLVINKTNNIQAIFGTAVGTNPVGGGSIVLNQPNPIPFGTTLTVSAIPNAGNFFVTWSGAASGTNAPTTIAVTNANPTINALFSALPGGKYSLAVVVIGNGSVVISPHQDYYSAGVGVTLSATNAGTNFYGWTGAASGTNNPLMVVMSANKIIQANFVNPASLSLGFSPALTINGMAGQAYGIQSSSNVMNTNLWVTLTNLTLTQPVQIWVDTNVDASSPLESKHFYRAASSASPANLSLGFSPALTISGVAGQTYSVQSSTNAANTNLWVTLTKLTLTQPVEIWVDTNVDTSSPFDSQYFYRILPGP